MIVVDANVLLYSYFPSEHKLIIDKLFFGGPQLDCPCLVEK